ncbi:MAG TPA: hypothetical protein VJ488_00555, partial [Dehalococcoidia bacterium]|nr:hypothetical protein [Dehalococcoidia bacterium]
RIEIVGEELKQLKFKVKLPREELREFFPQLEIKGAEKACSGCLIPVISGLMLLHEQGLRLEKPLTLYMGKNPAINPAENYIVIGDCALAEGGEHRYFIHGCAPLKEKVMSTILAAAGR